MADVIYGKDGDKISAIRKGFINLQESMAGFGDTEEEAKKNLFKQEEKLAREHIKGPTTSDFQGFYIFDDKSSMIAQVRGRGELQKLKNGIDVQVSVGIFIANAINAYLDNNTTTDEQAKNKV